MSDTVIIQTAQYAVSNTKQLLKTGSVGSCLVIALFEKTNAIGGLAHAMLPTRRSGISTEDMTQSPAKYVDEAIDHMLKDIEKLGGNRLFLEAKLIGGATMFRHLIREENSIGTQNVQFARDYLRKIGIHSITEDTGGSSGRSVELNTANGVVDVSVKL